MSYTTIIKQDGTVTQDSNTSFTDGRIWKLATGESLRISDGRKIFKMGADGAKVGESGTIHASTTNLITLAVNRDESKASVIYRDNNDVTINELIVDTMIMPTVRGLGTIYTTPLRAIIDKTEEKIIWLGDDNKLYKMDLDGGNLEGVTVGVDRLTFCMNTNNIIYLLNDSTISIIDNNLTLTTETISTKTRSAKDSFTLNEYSYFLYESGTGRGILKFNNNTKAYTEKDITTDNGIDGIVCQFNASGFDNNGTFFGEKDGVMRRWQVNLDNLECTPARWETYPTKQVFSNNTNLSLVDYSGVNGNNCDTAGLLSSVNGCTGAV